MEGPADNEWKVVLPRKGKPHARRLSRTGGEAGHLSCCSGHGPDESLDADEEPRLRVRLEKSMERVRSSAFFTTLVKQMQELQILETLLLASEARSASVHESGGEKEDPAAGPNGSCNSVDREASSLHSSDVGLMVECVGENVDGKAKPGTVLAAAVELVVLGVGSIRDSEVSRCQMSLALLLKERFSCIGGILVYDPVLSAMECGFLRNLGCTPIVRDEKGRIRAHCATLFYMPHCGASLYNNVLEGNLDPWCLGWISILGNSFQRYQDSWSVFPKPRHARPDCLLGMQEHVTEHPVNAASFPCLSAFNDMSWHLFPTEMVL